MHELSVIAGLFEIMEEKARENKARKIVTVKLQVGKLSGVIPEFLESAFEIYKKDTIAASASLEISEVPLRLRCRKCGQTLTSDDFVFLCPRCRSRDLETLSGTELVLERLEMEA